MRIRQSSLEAFGRCAQQELLYTQADQGLITGVPSLSATVFGSVIHHALHVMEELHHAGREDACDVAIATFEHYWEPENLTALEPAGITVWLPRQSYGGLRTRARANLRAYYEVLKADDGLLLALEHTFAVPIELVMDPATGVTETHELAGTLDRLAIRMFSRKPYLSIDDFKSGKKPTYLRYKTQWTVYAYASLQPAFWDAWTPEMIEPIVAPLHKRKLRLFDGDVCASCGPAGHDPATFVVIPRRGRWIAVKDAFGVHDTGWRLPNDYARLEVALREYVKAWQNDVHPLTMGGDPCLYCPFSMGICGDGTPLAGEKELPVWR